MSTTTNMMIVLCIIASNMHTGSLQPGGFASAAGNCWVLVFYINAFSQFFLPMMVRTYLFLYFHWSNPKKLAALLFRIHFKLSYGSPDVFNQLSSLSQA